MSSVHPNYKWADNKTTVWVTAEVPYVKKENIKVVLDPVGKLALNANVNGKSYEMKLFLRGRIRVEDSLWAVTNDRYIVFQLKKLEETKWKTLQKPSIKKPPYERIDWDKAEIEDSDEEDEDREIKMMDMDGMESSEDLNKLWNKTFSDSGSSFTMPGIKKGKDNKPNEAKGFVDHLDVLLLVFVALQIVVCPFTKVEESFNLQATHDILFHRTNITAYDHQVFPGVVPRSFIGPLFLAILSSPFLAPFIYIDFLSKLTALYVVRLLLGWLSVTAFGRFRKEVGRRFGETTAVFLVLITMCQFHLAFYMSRPLPNIFALILVLFAFSYWLQEKYYPMIAISVAAAAIFRSELALLFAPIFVDAILKKRISVWKSVPFGFLCLVLSIGLTVLVDSYFWGKPVWPEGEVFYFNVVLNKSSEWGTSPFHWYFTNAIPRALLGAIPLVFVGLRYDSPRLIAYLRPLLIFLVLYSFLPHKELRFIFPSIPLFNMMAAVGISRLYTHSEKFKYKILFIATSGLLLMSHLATWGFLMSSSANYPGGNAFVALHEHELRHYVNATHPRETFPYVHIDNLAAITGVSRFGENPQWRYSKQEGEISDYSEFTHLLSPKSEITGFEVIHTENGFDKIDWKNIFQLVAGGKSPVIKSPRIYAHKRKGIPPPITSTTVHLEEDNREL